MDALRAGTAQPTADMLGHKVDLPGQMQAKMESAFGADLSGVQLYESQAVADAGAEAITQGNRIAFAPGQLDFTSMQGQALFGHELSHVVSQARGEVSGGGFLDDHALEARADREGFLAAQGKVYLAVWLHPCRAYRLPVRPGPCRPKSPKRTKVQPRRRRLQRGTRSSPGAIPRCTFWPACRRRRHNERSAVTPSSKPCMMPMANQPLQHKWMKHMKA